MAMSPLQLGLIGAGIVLVVGVLIYNWWQERRVRQRIDAAFRPSEAPAIAPAAKAAGLYIHAPRGRAGRHIDDHTEQFVDQTRMGVAN